MADGVLTSSLDPMWCELFFGTQVLPKNRGACVDTSFWQAINLYKMALNGKVFYIKEFYNFNVNIFVV